MMNVPLAERPRAEPTAVGGLDIIDALQTEADHSRADIERQRTKQAVGRQTAVHVPSTPMRSARLRSRRSVVFNTWVDSELRRSPPHATLLSTFSISPAGREAARR